jgi:hypothetical protein
MKNVIIVHEGKSVTKQAVTWVGHPEVSAIHEAFIAGNVNRWVC